MNRYKLVHVTQFSYDGIVTESYNELRLRPRHDEGQSCLSFRVTTNPAAKAVGHQDYFGNWVHQFHILPEHRKLRVETEAVVLMHPVAEKPVSAMTLTELDVMRDDLADEHFDWLVASAYCPFVPAILDLAADAERACDGTVHGFVQTASALIHARFRYQQGATHVHSSVEDCLETQAGVCQDFSHLLLAIVRSRGIPARYVSGYLVPRQGNDERAAMERVIGGLASHAWVQVFIPETGWIGLDPTSGEYVDAQHIRIAYGRDYGDVPPVRGVYKGHAGQSLAVDVHVRPAVDDEGAELLLETSATPPLDPEEEQHAQQQQQQQ